MAYKPRRLVTVLTLLAIGFGGAAITKADLIINTPAGLVVGDTFRIAFVTDAGTEATSTDINYYNTFVNNDAITEAGGGANVVTYDGMTLTFAAIASTATTNAVTNIGEYGAPVYLSNGTLVAPSDNSTGLWSGALTNPLSKDLKGETSPATDGPQVWTGTAQTGIESRFPLGDALGVTVGYSNATALAWIQADHNTDPAQTFFPLYGISQELTVLSVVPEPSSVCLAMLGLGAAITMSIARRRRKP